MTQKQKAEQEISEIALLDMMQKDPEFQERPFTFILKLILSTQDADMRKFLLKKYTENVKPSNSK